MDDRRFDAISRTIAAAPSRRRIIAGVIGALLASRVQKTEASKLSTIPSGTPMPIVHAPCLADSSAVSPHESVRDEIGIALGLTCAERTFSCTPDRGCCGALDVCQAVPACMDGTRVVYNGTTKVCCLDRWWAGCCNDCDCCGDLVCDRRSAKCIVPPRF